MKEITMTEALQNLGGLIDEAIKKIHIWEDDPDETRKALNKLKITRKHLTTYLRARGRDRRSHDPSMITNAVVERAPRQHQRPKSRRLTQEEQQHLLAELKGSTDQRLKLLVPLILFTGIRPAEARSLTWRDIDTEHMRLTVHRIARYSPTIPIPGVLLSTITEHRFWFQQMFGFPAPNHYVFPASSDPYEQARHVRKDWQHLVRRTGIQCRLYDLRFTCITRLVEAGGDGVAPDIGDCARTSLRYSQNLTKPSS